MHFEHRMQIMVSNAEKSSWSDKEHVALIAWLWYKFADKNKLLSDPSSPISSESQHQCCP